jgi:c(7)-type cytochrome triheme protein
MTDARWPAVLLAVLLLGAVAARTQGPLPPPGRLPPGPVQPLPYSHKRHLALGLECRTCHAKPDPGVLMTFPPAAVCMACHRGIAADRPAIQKLAALAASEKPIPWVRVYRVPDYVYWKHTTHLDAGVTCAECHGPVAERDVIAQETNVVTMAGCLACHNKRQVFTDCGDCHAPRQ